MTPVAGGLGLSLVIVGGFFAFYFIVVTRFTDSKCPSRLSYFYDRKVSFIKFETVIGVALVEYFEVS